jgi:hypothetical protein
MSDLIVNILKFILDLLIIIMCIVSIVRIIIYKQKKYFFLFFFSVLLTVTIIFFVIRINEFISINLSIKWDLYNDDIGNFSILFPEKIKKEEWDTSDGHFVEITSDLKNKHKICFFSIKYIKNSNTKKVIQENNDYFFKEKNFVELDKKEITNNGYINTEYIMMSKDKEWELNMKYIYNNNVLYILYVFGISNEL